MPTVSEAPQPSKVADTTYRIDTGPEFHRITKIKMSRD